MTPRPNISIFISRLAFSLLLCLAATTISAQGKLFALQKFSISVDIAGPIVKSLGDYGEYEAALRLNLHDQYFPVFELGYGEADHNDEITQLAYSTQAPYFRLGCDINLLKNKHSPNRIYGGLRYAFTSYKMNMSRPSINDPV